MIKQNVTDLAGATGSADFEIIAIVSAARSIYWLRLFIFITMPLRNTEDQLGGNCSRSTFSGCIVGCFKHQRIMILQYILSVLIWVV